MVNYIYLTTDAREAIALMNEGCYQPTDKSIRINGKSFPIEDLPMNLGREVQRKLNLEFNPMSFILGDMTPKERGILVGKFVEEGLFVALHFNNRTIHESPDKYKGYQGGGFC